MTLEKADPVVIQAIGKQGDPEEILLLRVIDRVVKQFFAKAHPAKIAMDDDVLEQDDEAAFRGADREEQIDHPEDRAVLPEDKNPAPVWLLKDQPQPAHLLGTIWDEIGLMGKQIKKEIC